MAEYYAMAEAGILAHDERVELLDGDVILMTAVLDWHAFVVDWLNENFVLSLQGRAQARIQNPTRLNEYSEPEPDVMLLRRRGRFLSVGASCAPPTYCCSSKCPTHPYPYDRNQKLPRYARAGIPEVCIVNRP